MTLQNEKLLIHLPIAPPAGWLEKARERLPGVEIIWEQATWTKSGLSPMDDLPEDVLKGVTLMCPGPPYPPFPPKKSTMKDVKFVQLISAGWDLWEQHEIFHDKNVQFCSGTGVNAPQIAEWVIGTWLAHVLSFRRYAKEMDKEDWNPLVDLSKMGTDSVGRRMGILGYGAIGRQVARLASAMGMEIYVFTNNPRPTPESRVDGARYCVPGTGDPEGLIPSRWFSGSLDEFLAQDLDIVVVAAGLTDDTRGMIGKRQLEIMGGEGKRKKAFLTNVARGPVVQTDALVEALEQDVIAGAALDVTDPEPLPEGHPLWKAPNVFITPHIAWQSKNVMARSADLLLANLTRLDKGEPLLNVIKDR